MAAISLSLGARWEAFIQAKVESGRYGSANEVAREALKVLENRDKCLEPLSAHLAEGKVQADSGEFVEDFSVEKLIADADRQTQAPAATSDTDGVGRG